MIGLECSHNCDDCPGWTISGKTHCLIMNKVLKVMNYEIQTSKQLYENAIKEGETL